MFKAINRLLFLVLVVIFGVSFFSRKSYRQVENIDPKVLREPSQEKVESKETIDFAKDDYEYELTPLFEYEISGLVVHTFDYSFLGLYETASLFPVDLCIIWGSNVGSGVYKNKALKFSQDQRWCWYRWTEKLDFNPHEGANNHLLIIDEALRKKAKAINTGDQVRIKGKLVNVLGKSIGDERSGQVIWKSSTTRTDGGAGGCEVIYVEDLEVLKEGHPYFNVLQKASLYGIGIWILVNFFVFIKEVLV
jgi:hypothetical protein